MNPLNILWISLVFCMAINIVFTYIHSLSHLANDCRVHGSLESFSAYPFESFLGSIKGLIRSGYSELAQIGRRLSEYDAFETEPINN